jgi:low affinity Fe/Cu permease
MVALLRRFAAHAPAVAGSPWAFLTVLVVTAAWVASGPLFDWSSNWVLWPATITSVGAFILVLLLQYTQNRDTRAVQLKLDEIIRSLDEARTPFVKLEQRTDEELDEIEDEFEQIRDEHAAG